MTHHLPIVAIVGLCGAGKSEVANEFSNNGFTLVRFGQITLDEVKRRGLDVNEANERLVREALRHEHGMAAFAKLNVPVLEQLRAQRTPILIDGLYSWSEYKLLKEHFGDDLIVVAVYAPPALRYERLEHRHLRHQNDPTLRYRSFSKDEARSRDVAEIENIEKAGPIVMASFTILNTGTLDELKTDARRVRGSIIAHLGAE